MILRLCRALCAAVMLASPAAAEEPAPSLLDSLYGAAQMERHFLLFQESQLVMWEQTAARDFPDLVLPDWTGQAIAANGLDRIEADFTEGFLSSAFSETQMRQAIQGYGSDFGRYLQDLAFETVALIGTAEGLDEAVQRAEAAGDPALDVIDTVLLARGSAGDALRFYREARLAYYLALAEGGAPLPGGLDVAVLMARYDAEQPFGSEADMRASYRRFLLLFAEEMDDAALLDWLEFATADWSLSFDHAFQTGVRRAYVASAARMGQALAAHLNGGAD